jgi:glycosyltransferase involved in cell wall biosynthesis
MRLGTVGTGMTAWHQVAGLVQKGVRVGLCAGSVEKEIPGLDLARETLVIARAKVPIRLIGRRRALMLHDRIVARVIRRMDARQRYDIVHCWPSGALETLKAAREQGMKSVLERPNSHTRYAFETVRRECARLGITLPARHSHAFDQRRLAREESEFALADKLLCPSKSVAKTFLDRGFEPEKLALCRYGADAQPSAELKNNGRSHDDGPFRMVFLGTCDPRKGLHYALDAWLRSKACEQGKFYIGGKFLKAYRTLLADKLKHPSVEELGFVGDVSTLLRKCHVLVLPSIEEGSALVTYEAQLCGCVLLVSSASGAYCRHGENALVHDVGDVDTLREHIDTLAFDRAFYHKLRQNSLAAMKDLTWDRSADVLVGVYRDLLGKRASA